MKLRILSSGTLKHPRTSRQATPAHHCHWPPPAKPSCQFVGSIPTPQAALRLGLQWYGNHMTGEQALWTQHQTGFLQPEILQKLGLHWLDPKYLYMVVYAIIAWLQDLRPVTVASTNAGHNAAGAGFCSRWWQGNPGPVRSNKTCG